MTLKEDNSTFDSVTVVPMEPEQSSNGAGTNKASTGEPDTSSIPPQSSKNSRNNPEQMAGSQSKEPSSPGVMGLGRGPCCITCPYCNMECTTKPHQRIDAITILCIIIVLLVFWPLFWLPLVLPGCKTVEHTCDKCNRVVGKVDACQ